MVTLELTEEEIQELERTLVGRVDLDLGPKIDKAMERRNLNEVLRLNKLKEINQGILSKIDKIPHNSPYNV